MKLLRQGIRQNVMKIILLMIFSLYTCSTTFFTHSHIVEGLTIIHSHFYDKGDDGKPSHIHTTVELQLIQILSTYSSFETIISAVLIGLFASYCKKLLIKANCASKLQICFEQLRLRAPPVL